jgi:hypothetical protein
VGRLDLRPRLLLTLLIMPSQCEARTAMTAVALARHTIGACNHEATDDGAAVDGPGAPEAALAP